MNSYVKPVIFTLIFAVSIWEVFCIGVIPPQGTTIINQKAASSSSFINQESNQPQNIPHSNPVLPAPNNGPQSGPVTSTPNRGGSRDYVNPNKPQPRPVLPAPNTGPQSNPVTSAPNRGGSRDYVNPTRPQSGPVNSQNARNVPVQPTSTQSGTNRGAVRDYVNPSISQGGGVPSGTTSPQGQQFRPSPRNSNLGSRDYVNPNVQTSYANIAGGNNQNPPQRSNFPSLPIRNNQPLPLGQSIPSTTPLSYASKVSGGVTTKSPIGQQRPFVSGPSTSTTKTPDEGPTDVELKEFSEDLLRKDVNNAAKFLTVNVQGKTTSQSKNDEAPDKLLVIQPDAYQISTISKLKLLHNNYILETSVNEHVTPQEKLEENELLEAMLTTPVMQHTRNFLISNGKLSKDPKDFKDLLKVLWFNMYSRGGGRIGSSGFEHIFLAELKNKEVSGLHNWVYFDQAEMNKIVDYLGYMKQIDLGEKGVILKFHFTLNGVDKPVGSMFIGTSPELEMALYTTCYMFRADRICPLRLNGKNFIVRTFNYRYRGKNMIGSAFPEI